MPLRVLCFHGYRQTGGSFRGRLGALRRSLRKLAELDFLDGPVLLPAFEQQQEDGSSVTYSDRRSWWRASEDGSVYDGVDATLEYVISYMQENGPFDGVLGFSQGATLVLLLCGLRQKMLRSGQTENRQDHPLLNLRFCIAACGFRPRAHNVQHLFAEDNTPFTLPSLHVLGEADQIIVPAWTEAMASLFEGAHIHRHPGAHLLPAGKRDVVRYWEFLMDFIMAGPQKDELRVELEERKLNLEGSEDAGEDVEVGEEDRESTKASSSTPMSPST